VVWPLLKLLEGWVLEFLLDLTIIKALIAQREGKSKKILVIYWNFLVKGWLMAAESAGWRSYQRDREVELCGIDPLSHYQRVLNVQTRIPPGKGGLGRAHKGCLFYRLGSLLFRSRSLEEIVNRCLCADRCLARHICLVSWKQLIDSGFGKPGRSNLGVFFQHNFLKGRHSCEPFPCFEQSASVRCRSHLVNEFNIAESYTLAQITSSTNTTVALD